MLRTAAALSSLVLSLLLSTLASAQVTFTDVTSTSGIGLGEGTARGIAWGDFNNDGLADLFLPTAGSSPNKLYKNNPDRVFTEIAAAVNLNDMTNTITCSWADFDNDGDLDLLTTATAGPTRLWRNNRNTGTDTTFLSIETTAGIVMTGAQMPVWADYNRDGFVDFYSSISNSSSSTDALYRNNGNETFTNVVDSAGVNHMVSGVLEQGVSWGDYNKDGYPDLFIGNLQSTGPSFFHRNNGNGTFTEIAATLGFAGAARGTQWVDYNNDGLWDFSVAGYAGGTATIPVKLFRNNGDGTFTDVASSVGMSDAVISWGVTWADYDNNGYEDCFVAVSGQSTSCLLYKNNTNGTFSNVTNQAGLGSLVQLSGAWADYDNDGNMDLYTSGAASAGNHLFRNGGDPTKKWLEIKLVGIQSNKSGVGAQIATKAGSLQMLREITTGVGYRSQNMMVAHFGLDTNRTVDSIIVKWPSGRTNIQLNVGSNQRITITEAIAPHVGEFAELPSQTKLLQNYPNPFNPGTIIRYTVGRQERVQIVVYDGLGRTLDMVVDKDHSAGTYEIEFIASSLSSGVYYYQMKSGSMIETRKFVVMK